MRPDLGTIRDLPCLEGTVMVLFDVLDHHNHDPVPHSRRAVLKKQIAQLEALGLDAMMVTERGFFLFAQSHGEIREGGFRDLKPLSGHNEDYNICQTTKEEHVLRPGAITCLPPASPLKTLGVRPRPAKVSLTSTTPQP